ncbi:MAG: SipW-dependent-type signal peptide-containing protein [Slackia sp.]|nr:SipW-dependent-type signal peptide-containing protein [Slackia sp.]
MNASTQNTGRKRTTLIVALVACLVLAVGAGVFAWFSDQDTKTNTFTQGGGITDPTEKPKPDPNPDGSGDGDINKPLTPPEGNIIETEWDDEKGAGIIADSIVAKNPNVGIGKNSKDAYVFVEVENALDAANAYFVLGDKWAPVDGLADQYTKDKDATITAPDRTYTGGLFVYVGTNKTGVNVDDMAMLTGKSDVSVYTGEVFDKIYTNADFTPLGDQEKKTITVKAYLAAASTDTEDMTTAEVKEEILNKAKAWAGKN